jgi:hypothetical protein
MNATAEVECEEGSRTQVPKSARASVAFVVCKVPTVGRLNGGGAQPLEIGPEPGPVLILSASSAAGGLCCCTVPRLCRRHKDERKHRQVHRSCQSVPCCRPEEEGRKSCGKAMNMHHVLGLEMGNYMCRLGELP